MKRPTRENPPSISGLELPASKSASRPKAGATNQITRIGGVALPVVSEAESTTLQEARSRCCSRLLEVAPGQDLHVTALTAEQKPFLHVSCTVSAAHSVSGLTTHRRCQADTNPTKLCSAHRRFLACDVLHILKPCTKSTQSGFLCHHHA
jgi:hypothetical protein